MDTLAPKTVLDYSLTYASRGWHVIPVHGVEADGGCTCHSVSCPHPGKHPVMSGKFERYATTDPTIITGWFSKWPQMNVGIVCGPISGLWVLDLDGAPGMLELDDFEEQRPASLAPLGALRVRTGSGGMHLYFRWDSGQNLKTKNGARFKVDVKCNGYVVAPPSRHASGVSYDMLDVDWQTRVLPSAPDDMVIWLKSGGDGVKGAEEGGQDWPSVEEMLKNGLPEGQRDEGLFHAAHTLLKQGVPYYEVEAICDRIAAKCSPPFPQHEARAKVAAAAVYLRSKRGGNELDDVLSSWARGAGVSGNLEAGELWQGFGGRSDLANARRLRATWANGRPLAGGGWLVWNGTLWERSDRPLDAIASHLGEVLRREVELSSVEQQEDLLKWKVATENAGRISACAQIAETMKDWVVQADELDANPWIAVDAAGWVVNLRTGEVRRGEREDLCTRSWGATWEGADADCPVFKRTLEWALRDEEPGYAKQIAEAAQIYMGVCLTGVTLKNFAVMHGPGNTGKSTLIEAFARALGGYAGPLPRDLITVHRGGAPHPTGLTELEGRRFVYASEPDVGEELNVQLIKDITGGETLLAHKMKKDFYSFPLRAKLVVDTNHPLRLGDVSRALEERLLLLGLRSEVPVKERLSMTDVREQLDREAAGIVAWAWRGLRKYVEAGCPGDLSGMLGMALLAERAEDVAEQDVVGQWIEARLVEVEEDKPGPTAGEIRADFEWWCEVSGHGRYSVDKFAREVKARLRAGVGLERRYERVKLRREGVDFTARWWGIVLRDQ